MRNGYAGIVVALVAIGVASGCTERSPVIPTSALKPDSRQQKLALGAMDTDLVATPNGWYHRDCVSAIPNGSHVDIHGLVRRPDGTTLRIPMCSHPGRVERSNRAFTGSPDNSGWMQSETYDVGTAWGSISASWHVPSAPGATYGVFNDTSQVFYAFPGIQTNLSSTATIFQPVLTYGQGGNPVYGGNYWTLTAWSCGSMCHHSDTVLTVSPGDSLVGTVAASACGGGICTWTVTAVDVTTGRRSHIAVDDSANAHLAVGGAMETYALSTCSDYPPNGVFLTGVRLLDQNFNQVTPTWDNSLTQLSLSPDCGTINPSATSFTISLPDDPGPGVSVSGPARGTEFTYVTATANPGGGVMPYTYAWSVNDTTACGNQSTCSAQLGAAGTITKFNVTVTDYYNLTATGFLNVSACPSNGPLNPCPPGGSPTKALKAIK